MSYRPHPTKNRNLPPNYKGPIWWQFEIWPDGRKREKGKATTKPLRIVRYLKQEDAFLYHADLLKNIKPTTTIATNPRLVDIIPDFLDYYKTEATAGTISDFNYAHNRFIAHFGPLRLTQINNNVVQQYKNQRLAETWLPGKPKQVPEQDTEADALRRKPITKRTVNKELSYLSSIIKWAENQEPPLIEPGSVKIKLYSKKQTKRIEPINVHTMEEAAKFIETIGDIGRYSGKNCNVELQQQMAKDRYGLVLLMYDAGLRKKEALSIEASRVNLPPEPIPVYLDGINATTGQNPDIILGHTYGTVTVIRKGGRIQTLPILTERLYNKLKEQMKKVKNKGYLYLNPRTKRPYVDIRDGLKSAGIAAKIYKKNNPHLFRHDFVTHLHEMGTDMKSIQELAGHSVLATTSEIYSHLTTNTLTARAKGFTDKIGKKVVTRSQKKPQNKE